MWVVCRHEVRVNDRARACWPQAAPPTSRSLLLTLGTAGQTEAAAMYWKLDHSFVHSFIQQISIEHQPCAMLLATRDVLMKKT